MYRAKLPLIVLFGIGIVILMAVSIRSMDTGNDVPVGIVVPHHDLVASARAAFLKLVGQKVSSQTIVLLSPDHFNTARASLTASTKEWTTSVGVLLPNVALIESLGLTKDTADFDREHGITTLLRDIKTYFPTSQIVPIMVNTKITYEEIQVFTKSLYEVCPDCLLVASVDFSHTVQADLANLHDQYTLRELYQGDSSGLYTGAEVDSPGTLAALALWAEYHAAEHFDLFTHTNSGYITGRQVGEMTTHIIGGYEAGARVVTKDSSVTLLFGGDVMFARAVEETHKSKPEVALTGGLGERFFWGVDVALVNLEGVFTKDVNYRELWAEFPPRLLFKPNFIEALTAARITDVGLANNHRFDGRMEEYSLTQVLLTEAGIMPLVNTHGDDPRVRTVQEGEVKIALMTIATHDAPNDLAPTIQQYSEEGYFVIVYPHWGNEEAATHSPEQESMAKRWVDAGADLIVGSHPHVVQPASLYKGVPIFYSLGNLLFDQVQSKDVQTGAVLGVEITEAGQELFLLPVSSYLKPEVLNQEFPDWLNALAAYRTEQTGNTYLFPRINNNE